MEWAGGQEGGYFIGCLQGAAEEWAEGVVVIGSGQRPPRSAEPSQWDRSMSSDPWPLEPRPLHQQAGPPPPASYPPILLHRQAASPNALPAQQTLCFGGTTLCVRSMIFEIYFSRRLLFPCGGERGWSGGCGGERATRRYLIVGS